MNVTEPNAREATAPTAPTRVVSGRKVVLGMLGFGILTTAAIWTYWEYHRAPFWHVEQAIIAKFPESAPRVEGGQRQMHKGTPRILRAVLKIDFSPKADGRAAQDCANEVARVMAEAEDLRWYDRLEVHLYHLVPEHGIEEWKTSFDAANFASAGTGGSSSPDAAR